MAQIIDLDKIAQTIAPSIDRYKQDSEKPGSDGALARLGMDCDLALILWRCKESNRGTDANDLIEALMTAFAAHVVGELMQNAEPADRVIAALNIGGGFIQKVLAGCNAVQTGECPAAFVPSKEVGTA